MRGESNSTDVGKKSSSLPVFTRNSSTPFAFASLISLTSHSMKLSFGYYASRPRLTLTKW